MLREECDPPPPSPPAVIRQCGCVPPEQDVFDTFPVTTPANHTSFSCSFMLENMRSSIQEAPFTFVVIFHNKTFEHILNIADVFNPSSFFHLFFSKSHEEKNSPLQNTSHLSLSSSSPVFIRHPQSASSLTNSLQPPYLPFLFSLIYRFFPAL